MSIKNRLLYVINEYITWREKDY